MCWREIPYSTRMVKVGEYDKDIFVRTICMIEHPRKLSEEQKRDAKLIATAPDLLIAIEGLLPHIVDDGIQYPESDFEKATLKLVQAYEKAISQI